MGKRFNLLSMFSGWLFKYKVLILEIVLYGLIGVISSITDSIVFYFLSMFMDIYTSNYISINVGITLSFFMNTFINFKRSDNLILRAISFYSVGYIGMLLSMLLLFINVELLDYNKMTVKISSVFIVAAFQFVFNKFITFRQKG